MTDALVSFVVEELGAIVKDEVGLLANVEKELKRLSSTFSAIQALLADAERKQVTTEGVRVWLGKIKEVAYEAEDILDECRTDAFIPQYDDGGKIQKMRSCSLFPCLCFNLKSRHDMGHRIREVRDKLNEISKEKNDFNLEKLNMGEGMSRLNKEERETSSLIDESGIFGRDEVKKEIIGQLVGETGQKEKPISIVSIVGMGGLGKTALAQLVHNDEGVEAYFEKTIWVCVSDPPDLNKIATKVIKSLNGSDPDNLDQDTLLLNLRKAVDGKRFLLVLDDVWDENGTLWQKLRVPLKSAAPGSRILVTTRSRSVAEKMETTHIHDLDVLSNSDCWELFESIAFKGAYEECQELKEECQELKEIGEKIVEKCKGVPLAIRALGSLLHANRKKWYWEHVLESEIWNIRKDDIGEDDGILPALLLSYYNLPPRLKGCFSFCSVFPKDHEIRKDELVKLWMAHGVIKSEKAKKDVTEEIGEKNFDDLMARSLFQDAKKDTDGNVVGCKMHDLVHDLATFVSSGDNRNMEAGDSELCCIKCHHLSLLVNEDVSSIPSPLCSAEGLRTLLLYGSSRIMEVPDSLFNCLRYLRALDLSIESIENLPSSIGNLKHLRYLKLDGSNIRELPESITELFNLQTLKLNHCGELCTLPGGMSKMVKLRHLEIQWTEKLLVLPNGLRRLTSLRTLCKFPMGDENRGCKIGELKDLNLLRGELSIENLERVMNVNDASEAELHKKSDLHVLSLCCNKKSDEEWRRLGDDEMKRMDSVLEGLRPPHSNLKELKIKNYAGSKFPSWLEDSRFSSAVKVVLEDCRKCMLLPGLGKLHSLKYLEIIGADKVEVVGGEFYGNDDARVQETRFPKLEELYFKSMLHWEEWKLMAMPSLKNLEIFDCKMLKAMPSDGWGLLESLHTLRISCCPELASLPDGLGQLKALHTLKIRGCERLSSLPKGLGQLKALSISDCERLSSLPEGLVQLKDLAISNCERWSSLPEGLGQLKDLQISDCRRWSSLPKGLGRLKALQTLYIRNCKRLSSLPEELGQLNALQTLCIFYCEQLSFLPKGLGQLKALQTLKIWDCQQLSSLFDGLEQLKSLCTLDIWDCPLLHPPLPNLQGLPTLKSLSIKGCPLLTWRLKKEKEKGEDWCKISHIPSIDIDGEVHKGFDHAYRVPNLVAYSAYLFARVGWQKE